MTSLLTMKIKPNMFPGPFLILALALLPTSLANGQLFSDFLKDELLDNVIAQKAHPFDQYEPYPSGLADSLNDIAKEKQTLSNAILMPRVDVLCKQPEYFKWFEQRLKEVWQRKDAKIDEQMEVEQELQKESYNFSKANDDLIERVSGLESTKQELSAANQALSASVSGLESTNQELSAANQALSASVSGLESKIQELSKKGEGNSSFSWLGTLSIIVLSLLLIGALGLWWRETRKPKDESVELALKKRVHELGNMESRNTQKYEEEIDGLEATNQKRSDENIRLQNEINNLREELRKERRR